MFKILHLFRILLFCSVSADKFDFSFLQSTYVTFVSIIIAYSKPKNYVRPHLVLRNIRLSNISTLRVRSNSTYASLSQRDVITRSIMRRKLPTRSFIDAPQVHGDGLISFETRAGAGECRPDELSSATVTQFRARLAGELTPRKPGKGHPRPLRFRGARSTLRTINGLLALIKAHCGLLRNASSLTTSRSCLTILTHSLSLFPSVSLRLLYTPGV